ncbi:MAG TPA: hypothetical protein PLG12_10105, partial [Verrucomicrobiota bacterium]|nr:hypothetical protein [Verrucomicrobiota bacterium]
IIPQSELRYRGYQTYHFCEAKTTTATTDVQPGNIAHFNPGFLRVGGRGEGEESLAGGRVGGFLL